MKTGRRTTKIASIFILAFLCLNLGGVVCLSYCLQTPQSALVSDADAHLSDHCRLAKQLAEKEREDSSRVEADELSCCVLPVAAMFAGPVSKPTKLAPVVDEIVVRTAIFETPSLVASLKVSSPVSVYRPPPLDRRVERQLNCVIRI